MIIVDPEFSQLMRKLRQERRVSFRALAKKVHYSYSYLWEIEKGRKQPNPDVAKVLDEQLGAAGQLARLVTTSEEEDERTPVAPSHRPSSDYDYARPARSLWPIITEGRTENVSASQWARVASVLYDVFVRNRPPLVRLAPDRYASRFRGKRGLSPFTAEARLQGRISRVECYDVSRQQPPEDVAALLSLDQGEQVIVRKERYFADAEPVQLAQTYIPEKTAGTSVLATEPDLGLGGTFAALERLGYRVDRIREQITTRLATREESLALNLPSGVPVIFLLHVAIDVHGAPFEVTRFIMRSDLTAIQYAMAV